MERARRIAEMVKASGVPAEAQEVARDGKTAPAIVLGEGGFRPVIYLNNLGDCADEDAALRILASAKHLLSPKPFNEGDIFNWERAKKMVNAGFVHFGGDLNEGVISTDFLDLRTYFFLELADGAMCKITVQMMEEWGVDMYQILTAARENAMSNIKVMSMRQKMIELTGVDLGESPDEMYFIGNDSQGAAALLYPELFRGVADKFNDDLWLIPASIHEILAIPASSQTKASIEGMVKEVNDGEVSVAERLSYTLYRYKKDVNAIVMA